MENMTAEQAAEAAKGYTFETVWAALLEMRNNINVYIEKSEEGRQKAEAERQKTEEERQKTEEERQKTEEAFRRMEKTVSDLSKNIGGLGNMQGRLTEAMFEAELWKKFNELDFFFNKQSSRYKFFENGRVLAEADFFLENGEYAMPVEIKTELSHDDIDEHLERIATIRKYMDTRGDSRKLAGAVGGGIVSENALNYAHKKGLYVVMQTGDAVAIAAVPHNFTPREW
ncbi:MAG: DUF874 family protein [Oscillospiraceae bacterium]|nr:DUF874 family protein [Oscillospiraceae bacterium]